MKQQRNKYEQAILRPCFYFKVLFWLEIAWCLLGAFVFKLPLVLKLPHLAVAIVAAVALAGGLGYFNQNTPILAWGFVRGFEILFTLGLYTTRMDVWKVVMVGFGLDVIFLVALLRDKTLYEYVEESEEH